MMSGASNAKPPRLARETPVLALDGTGSLDLNRKIFGEHMNEHRFAAPRDAEVVQVSSKVFSRQSLTGCDRHRHPISTQKTADAARLRRQVIELLRLLPRPSPAGNLQTGRGSPAERPEGGR
jgi:hypothetical protein